MAAKRVRGANFSAFEKDCLIGIISANRNVVENKKTDAVTQQQKQQKWEDITVEFTAVTGTTRTVKQLQKVWENIKKGTRKEYGQLRVSQKKTGGGPPDTEIGDGGLNSQVLDILGTSATGLDNKFDCDGSDNSVDYGHYGFTQSSGEAKVSVPVPIPIPVHTPKNSYKRPLPGSFSHPSYLYTPEGSQRNLQDFGFDMEYASDDEDQAHISGEKPAVVCAPVHPPNAPNPPVAQQKQRYFNDKVKPATRLINARIAAINATKKLAEEQALREEEMHIEKMRKIKLEQENLTACTEKLKVKTAILKIQLNQMKCKSPESDNN